MITDADSLLEPDAITRSVRPFEVHPDSCMAAGGGIRVANGSRIAGGRVVAPGIAWRGVGAPQVLEYMRGFSATRIAWSKMNGLLIISGAFGVFRRDVLVALGGFSGETLGEDMEMTMRIHHVLRPQMQHARVEFVPDAVCWTEAPSTMGGLRNQRIRWHTGLLDDFRLHWRMFGRPRYGAAGTVAMPYMFLFEAIEPLVEVGGFAIVITLLIENAVNWTYLVAFILIAALTGAVMSAASLLIEEIGFHRYRAKDLARLTAWGLVEAFWFRPPQALVAPQGNSARAHRPPAWQGFNSPRGGDSGAPAGDRASPDPIAGHTSYGVQLRTSPWAVPKTRRQRRFEPAVSRECARDYC